MNMEVIPLKIKHMVLGLWWKSKKVQYMKVFLIKVNLYME